MFISIQNNCKKKIIFSESILICQLLYLYKFCINIYLCLMLDSGLSYTGLFMGDASFLLFLTFLSVLFLSNYF